MQLPVILAQQGDMGIPVWMIVLYLAVIAILFASLWAIFVKAGKPGWAGIIPIYNAVVLLEIVNRPLWWIILMIIPCTAPFVGIVLALDLAKAFGKDTLFAVGMMFLPFIFYPLLAFGDATYRPISR